MIADAFLWVLNRTPSLRRAMWRFFFDALAARFGNIGWWTLMNYGYAEPDGPREGPGQVPPPPSPSEPDRPPSTGPGDV